MPGTFSNPQPLPSPSPGPKANSPDAPKGVSGPRVIYAVPDPVYLSGAEVAKYALDAGFRGQALVNAVAIAGAESSWYTGAYGPKQRPVAGWMYGDGEPMGLMQIIPAREDSGQVSRDPGSAGFNQKPSKSGPRDVRRLFDPAFNMRSAYEISRQGTDWGPWSTWPAGARKWLDRARSAIAEIGQTAIAGVPDATSNGTPTIDPEWTGGPLYPLRVGGIATAGELGTRLVGGSYDASAKQPNQVTLELEDTDLSLLTSGKVKAGARIGVNTDRYTIITTEIVNGPAGPHVGITALPEPIVKLMHTDPPSVQNVYGFDYVRILARSVGLSMADTGNRAVGGKQTIEPKTLDLAGDPDLTTQVVRALNPYAAPLEAGKRRETGWDIISRLAGELGNDVFLVGSSLYFAPATGAIDVDRLDKTLVVAWPGRPTAPPPGAYRALDVPRVRFSNPSKGRAARATATVTLAPEHRWAATVGQTIDLGLGDLLTKTTKTLADTTRPTYMRITRVSWALADLTGPVTIEAEVAVDTQPLLEALRDVGTEAEATGTTTPAAGVTPFKPGYAANGAQLGWALGGATTSRRIRGSSVSLTVAKSAGDLLQAFATEFNQLIEPLIPGQCGGYVFRTIAGTSTWSNHAYGIAVDLNWQKHPQHKRGTFTAAQARSVNSLCAKYKLFWGGNWSTGALDEMHVEVAVGPTQAAELGARLLAQL